MGNCVISACSLFSHQAVLWFVMVSYRKNQLRYVMAAKLCFSCGLSEQTILLLSLSLCYSLQVINQLTVPKGEMLEPGKVFQLTVHTLNFSCPQKMPWNQIKITSTFKNQESIFQSSLVGKGTFSCSL